MNYRVCYILCRASQDVSTEINVPELPGEAVMKLLCGHLAKSYSSVQTCGGKAPIQ